MMSKRSNPFRDMLSPLIGGTITQIIVDDSQDSTYP